MGKEPSGRTTLKVLVLAEGQTEETFLKRVVAPHLEQVGVFVRVTVNTTKVVKQGSNFKGGVTSYARVKKELLRLLGDSSAGLVTTMIDYYGLPDDFPGRRNPQGTSPIERVGFVERSIREDIGNERFFPYLSLHEFEALLFAGPNDIAQAFPGTNCAQEIRRIRDGFSTPEEINDNPVTAPSARLRRVVPAYQKLLHGTVISSRIGINRLRSECGHFSGWITRLESA